MANTKNKARNKKIKNKLIFLLLPVVIVTILVLVGIATVLSRNSMTDMATAQLDSSISNQADNIEAWLDENLENFSKIKYYHLKINLLEDRFVGFLRNSALNSF